MVTEYEHNLVLVFVVSNFCYMLISALYASCLVGNFVEQLWSFAWPAAIAMIHPSLLPVAVMSFFTKVALSPKTS